MNGKIGLSQSISLISFNLSKQKSICVMSLLEAVSIITKVLFSAQNAFLSQITETYCCSLSHCALSLSNLCQVCGLVTKS